jgi:hypothetical protein
MAVTLTPALRTELKMVLTYALADPYQSGFDHLGYLRQLEITPDYANIEGSDLMDVVDFFSIDVTDPALA